MNRSFQLLLAVLFTVPLIAFSQHYIADKDFASCGTSRVDFPVSGTPELKTTRVLPNKRIVSAGIFFHAGNDSISLVMVQYLSDGRMDTLGFGNNGIVFTKFQLQSYVNNIALQPDGKIIAVGYANNTADSSARMPAVFRFTANGQPDATFSNGGFFSIRFDDVSSGFLQQAVVLPGGKMLAAGIAKKVGTNGTNGIGLLQLKSNGTLDSTFGNLPGFPGRSLLQVDSASDAVLCIVNGQPVVSFIKNNGVADTLILVRFHADGTVDSNFGVNGILNTGIPSENLSCSCKDSSLHLLLGGTLNEPGQVKKMQLIRYTQSLSPDPQFGTNGRIVLPTIGPSNSDNVLHAVKELANGKILVLGHRAPPGISNPTPIILRLLPNGQPDTTFNGTGDMQVLTEFASGWNDIDTTDSTGFIISRTRDFMLMKFVPDTTRFNGELVTDFQFIVEKENVFFTNRSKNASDVFWNFGDGKTSTQVNPTHQFIPGRYPVKLETSGACGFGTQTKEVIVRGLYKISPSAAPSTGFTACRVFGFGFSGNEQIVLKQNNTILRPDTTFLDTASQSLQINFRFRNAPVGVYDVIGTSKNGCPGNGGPGCDTLKNAFAIQPANAGKPWIQINGPSVTRPENFSRRAFFSVAYGFTGNVTQYLIPLGLIISGKDKSLVPRLEKDPANAAEAQSLPDSLKPRRNGFYRLYDSIRHDSVWVMYLADVVVPAGETNLINFSVSQISSDSVNIRAFIGNTLFDRRQSDSLSTFRTKDAGCNNCMSCLLDAASYIPGPVGCAASVLGLACSVNNFEFTSDTTVGDVLNLGIGFACTAVGCATLVSGSFTKLMETFGGTVLDAFLQQANARGTASDCANALSDLSSGSCNPPGDEEENTYPMRKSIDPNSKTGPDGGNSLHYIGKKQQLVYSTKFENLPSATAPAVSVEITDTLDKSVMDLSTFRYGRVTIAGVDYPNFNTQDSFAMDILLSGKGIVLRTTGRIDTATGIASWTFSSLDSVTMGPVTDIDKGFLPPNTDSVSGTGAVTFSVQQKASNTHRTVINNKARIVFDQNEPINTPLWTNIVDTVKPQSQVLNSGFRILSDSTFSVKWSGADADAGVRHFKIAVSVNDSTYRLAGIFGTDSTVIKAKKGSLYKFISLVRDSAGNLEDPPADPLNHFDAQFVFSPSLPVELLSFVAAKENGSANLLWTTAQETNTSHFVIEHSTNGTLFLKVGSVKATGNSTGKQSYFFRHQQPVTGMNYYRLQMIDADGAFRYSPVRTLVFEPVNTMVVKPNPAGDKIFVSVSEPGGMLQFVNSGGRNVYEQTLTSVENTINISSLPAGIYILTYVTKDHTMQQQKLVVKR